MELHPQHFIGRNIHTVTRWLQSHMAKQLEPLGIGPGQYSILMEVSFDPGISQDKLAEKLQINKSTVTRSIVQLEEGGYLTRKVNAFDKRAYCLYPTEKTQQTVPLIREHMQGAIGIITVDFSPEERQLFENLLLRMLRNTQDVKQLLENNPSIDKRRTL